MNNNVFIIDIGNTQISFGIFNDDKLLTRGDYSSHNVEIEGFINYVKKVLTESKISYDSFKGGLISSVVPHLSRLIQIAINSVISLEIPILDNRINSFIEMDIDNPSEVGGDILADIVAAKEYYKCPALVVDLGTVTKYIVLDEKGVFIGTTFYPGIEACLDSLSDKTALLPNLKEFNKPKRYLGKNTLEAMESGIYYGTVGGIKGVSEFVKSMFDSSLTYILTGGFSNVIYPSLKDFVFDADLVLKGVNLLYKKFYEGK